MNHTTVSFVKSALRIIGFSILPLMVWGGVATLVLAEFLGILEEIV